MKVAYDWGPLLDPPTGVARYTDELASELELAGTDLVRYAVAFGGARDPAVRRWRVPARLMRRGWMRFGWPPIERLVGEVDLIHATNFVLPPAKKTAGVVTVHDLSFFRDDVFPGGHRLRELVPWSVDRAAGVLVPTAAVAEEVVERLGVSGDKVTVTSEGVSPVFFGASPLSELALERLRIPGPFVLAVGTLEPRKNLARLVAAWGEASRRLEGWTLVIAGPKGWGEELPPTPGVLLPGWIDEASLPGLMAAASVFCYPSLYEGFGLPPLEAMAAGTPVVAARYRTAGEVLGDAAELVDAEDVEALADALVRVATEPALRSALAMSGRARAAGFTWTRAAKASMDAYRNVIDG
ncbi:MAG: glycosyltransferase family 4 protein [Actinomycetota bacterium]